VVPRRLGPGFHEGVGLRREVDNGLWVAAPAVGETELGTGGRIRSVALFGCGIHHPVAAVRGPVLHEEEGVADGPVLAHHLEEQHLSHDRDAHEVPHGLAVGGEPALADLPNRRSAAAGRDVHGALARLDDDVVVQRMRALVVVVVARDDNVHQVRVEERNQIGAEARVAAVLAARIDGAMEGDELPRRRGPAELPIEEGVLRAAGTEAAPVLAVEDHDQRIPVLEGVVALVSGRVVRGRVESFAPGLAAVLHVVIPDARPEDQPAKNDA
jgi:hypothetical protein